MNVVRNSVFVSDKPFQPSLKIANKAGAYQSEVSFRCCTLGYSPGLTQNQ